MYPLNEKAVAKKVKVDYECFNAFHKAENCVSKPKSNTWYVIVSEFNGELTMHAYVTLLYYYLLCGW